MIISTLPREFESIEELGACITEGLAEGFDPQNATPATWRLLDKRILKETETLGWRIFTSELVRTRLCAWEVEPEGIERYRSLGEALNKFARTMHRRKPPLDPRIRENKRETVNELRLAFKVLRAALRTSRRKPASRELLLQFQRIIAEGDFPYLNLNPDSWVGFFAAKAAFVTRQLDNSRFSPAAIYDAWLAWATWYEQETLRQKISLLKQ
jgi:hypothetical protein